MCCEIGVNRGIKSRQPFLAKFYSISFKRAQNKESQIFNLYKYSRYCTTEFKESLPQQTTNISLIFTTMSEAPLKFWNNIRYFFARRQENVHRNAGRNARKLEVVKNERRRRKAAAAGKLKERLRKPQQYREMLIAGTVLTRTNCWIALAAVKSGNKKLNASSASGKIWPRWTTKNMKLKPGSAAPYSSCNQKQWRAR